MKALETKKTIYLVEVNENQTLNIKLKEGGENIPNIGWFINSMGGIEGVLKRCTDIEGTFEEFINNRHLQQKAIATQNKIERDKRKRDYENSPSGIALKERLDRERKEKENKLIELLNLPVIPVTVENLRLILNYLNKQNWGSWSLPKLSIGYSAHQYDCEGKIATTIKLDSPISDEEYGIENETMFKVGGKRGHLTKYRNI